MVRWAWEGGSAENGGSVNRAFILSTLYSGQEEPVSTVATVALLVGTTEATEAEAEKVVSFAFARRS